MKKILFSALLTSLIAAGVVLANGQDADLNNTIAPAASLQQTLKADQTMSVEKDAFGPVYGKKCNFQSDCKYGKCKRGRCGACDFQSDCRGWGKCKRGFCGACDFQSDCKNKGFGSCRSGRCTKSPY